MVIIISKKVACCVSQSALSADKISGCNGKNLAAQVPDNFRKMKEIPFLVK
jgi:hypothetical protein